MARSTKFDYDSNEFYDEIFSLAMQWLDDAEIADALADRFGESLSPEVFSRMKNGKYEGWTEEENERRSARLSQVLARGRRKINAVIKGVYLKAAVGGKKLKNKSTTRRKLRNEKGDLTGEEEVQTTESEIEQPPNIQALATWLYHHDDEWRKVERRQDEDEEMQSEGSIPISKWIEENTEMPEEK